MFVLLFPLFLLEVLSPNTPRFPWAAGKPRRTGRANADGATGRGVLNLPSCYALRGLTDALSPERSGNRVKRSMRAALNARKNWNQVRPVE